MALVLANFYIAFIRWLVGAAYTASMFRRDLMAEHQEKRRRTAAPTVESDSTAVEFETGFGSIVQSIEDVVFDVAAHATLVVDINDELADKLVNLRTAHAAEKVQNCLGIYFNTGAMLEHVPVWKQVRAQEGMSVMYIYKCDGWWVCSDHVFQQHTDVFSGNARVVFQANSDFNRPSGDWWPSGLVYSPPRSSSPNYGFQIEVGYEFMRSLADTTTKSLRDEHDRGESSHMMRRSTTKNAGVGGHGGWLPRAAEIAACVFMGDIEQARAVCDKYYNQGSQSFTKLVDKHCDELERGPVNAILKR